MDKDEIIVSFPQWRKKDLVETRANAFASRYLLPPSLLEQLPVITWNQAEALRWAAKLKVSTWALAIGLKESKKIDDEKYKELIQVRVTQDFKRDPELEGLTAKSLERKITLLKRGLSSFYVSLCFDAISEGVITNAKAAEMLIAGENELSELAEMFHVRTVVHD
jgi:Zn-dependent peptidase ImmA (M78 family)